MQPVGCPCVRTADAEAAFPRIARLLPASEKCGNVSEVTWCGSRDCNPGVSNLPSRAFFLHPAACRTSRLSAPCRGPPGFVRLAVVTELNPAATHPHPHPHPHPRPHRRVHACSEWGVEVGAAGWIINPFATVCILSLSPGANILPLPDGKINSERPHQLNRLIT